MDSVRSFVFGQIFERETDEVDLGGATTAPAINNRIKVESHRAKDKAKKSKVRVIREYFGYAAEQHDKLIAHDFAGRAIFEANKNPRGMIAQTLLYGKAEAKRRILAQKRAEVRSKRGFKIAGGEFY